MKSNHYYIATCIASLLCACAIYYHFYVGALGWGITSLFFLAEYIIHCIKEYVDSKFKF